MTIADQLKHRQSELKQRYLAQPATAVQTLEARGRVDPERLACHITHPEALNPAGLHPLGGGDGSFVCPVEIMLAGLVSCAGVTLAAVAHAMRIELKSAEIVATGTLDFCGTLAVNKTSPVGLNAVQIRFLIDTSATAEQLEKLIELTHRYCVVWRTLELAPELTTIVEKAG